MMKVSLLLQNMGLHEGDFVELWQIRGHFKNVFKICSCRIDSKKVVTGDFSISISAIITHKLMRWS